MGGAGAPRPDWWGHFLRQLAAEQIDELSFAAHEGGDLMALGEAHAREAQAAVAGEPRMSS